MAQALAHDWTVEITKRRDMTGDTVYAIVASGSCSDPLSSVQLEKNTKPLISTDVPFSASMTLAGLKTSIESSLKKAMDGIG